MASRAAPRRADPGPRCFTPPRDWLSRAAACVAQNSQARKVDSCALGHHPRQGVDRAGLFSAG